LTSGRSTDLDIAGLASSLGEEVPALLAEHGVPGMAVGICDRSSVVWAAGFGTVGARSRRRIRRSTMFSVQSASKMYTATAVMLAVQQGVVDLDEPICRYLPEFTVGSRFEANPERKITLRHLLSHTAGFTHEAPLGGNYEVRRIPFAVPGQELGFGLGTIVARWTTGVMTYGHGGGGFGFVCELNWTPHLGIGVVVLTNSSTNQLHVDLSNRIFGELIGPVKIRKARLPGPLSTQSLDQLNGEYSGVRGGTVTVTRDQQGLALMIAGKRHAARVVAPGQIELEEGPTASGRQLFAVKPGECFRFLPGADGRSRYMQSVVDGYVRYRRELLPGDRPVPFAGFQLGRYRIRSFGRVVATVELRNEDGRPVLASGPKLESRSPMGLHRPDTSPPKGKPST
jgi:hypothetical protein